MRGNRSDREQKEPEQTQPQGDHGVRKDNIYKRYRMLPIGSIQRTRKRAEKQIYNFQDKHSVEERVGR